MTNREALSEKTLVMLVGPSAIGKSTVMNEMVRSQSDFAYVRSFTTRPPRENEQSHYDFIDRSAAKALLAADQAITHFEHPTTHDIYGTTTKSYPEKYNLLDTLSGSVTTYRNLPFEATHTLAITAPDHEWQQWFLSRYPEPSAEAEKRLEEAVLSINWALKDPETQWVVNSHDTVREVAKIAISLVVHPPAERTIPEWPRTMLELIQGDIWHKK